MVFEATSKQIADFRKENNTEPLWTNSMFSGMPSYLISAYYPGNLIKKLYTLLRKPGIPLAPILLLMIGFYFLLLSFRVDNWIAILGAIAYGFSSYFFILLSAGHITKSMALAFMAPLIGSVIYSYRRDRLLGALFTAILLTLEIISNHLQITYYILMIIMAFGISELIHSIKSGKVNDFFKTTLLLFGSVSIAIIVNFASLYTTYEYGKYSIRGKSELTSNAEDNSSGVDRSYATQWSYGIDETLSFLVPNIKGGASVPFDPNSETIKALRKNGAAQYSNQFLMYWGNQPGTSGPVYIGSIVIFLFIMGLVLIKGRDKWWILSITLIAIMLSWGKNFMFFTNMFMDFLPGYSKFRAVTTILVIVQFCMPLLGFLVLDRLLKKEYSKQDLYRALKISGGITSGILILLLLFPGIAGSFTSVHEAQLPEWIKLALIEDRKNILRADSFRSLFFIISSGIIIFMAYNNKIKNELAIGLLIGMVLIDMWPVDKRYLNNDAFISKSEAAKTHQASNADKYILQDTGQYRVLNLSVDPFSDGTTSYFHNSIGGYHGAKIRRYQDLIENVIAPEINTLASRANNSTRPEALFTGLNALNMLNAKYIITNKDYQPMENNSALGSCWMVKRAITVDNPDEELAAIKDINPAEEAVVDKRFEKYLGSESFNRDSLSNISLESHSLNEIKYLFDSPDDALVVFSEIYYPEGWKAYIDENQADYFRVNYILRGMVVPAGSHSIIFRFDPESYKIGNKVSLAGSLVLIIFTILGLFIIAKKRKIIGK
jgi:hypothetical protein